MTWTPPEAEIVSTLNRRWWGGWKGTLINAVDGSSPDLSRKVVRAFTRARCLEKLEFWEKVTRMEWDDYRRGYGK